jgi:putative membrane-bound dehydrogenase-like protein
LVILLATACQPTTEQSTDPNSGLHLPEGYEIEVVAGPDLVDYPMFATLDESGRLFVFESTGNVYEQSQDAIDDPKFRIKLLVDEDQDGIYDKATVFADQLSFPQGGVFYNGSLIASSAPDLLKLTDTDGDGVADEREVLLSGWVLNVNANSLIGPFLGPDGWLYMTSAIEGFDVTSKEGERMVGETARIWRVRPDGSDLEWIAGGGMNNPVELAFTPAGEVLGTLTFFVYPQRGLRDAINFWVEGGVYGKRTSAIRRDGLPLTGELMPPVSQYSRVAPAGIGAYRSTALGSDFAGNYFTTQFNTHAVIRHRMQREGASFTMEDETFFYSDNTDFHPTDVLEDADGSLLVVETGGWFILGCPLSQVSKPQLKGAIYRIRRKDATPVEDPYGNAIDWAGLSAEEMSNYLADERPFVADRAVTKLVEAGPKALAVLRQVLESAPSTDARNKAVFALYRIGTPEAFSAMLTGLNDREVQVRIAAARVAGLVKAAAAVDRLMEMIVQDEPPVRRQAATALEQIGRREAVPALLEAAATAEDRFVQHAVIHALFTIAGPEQLLTALHSADSLTRRAALIALDQMAESPLRVSHLASFLNEDNEELQQTALWVASHHPEWSADMITYLRGQLPMVVADSAKAALFSQILTNYCGDPQMQDFMATQLQTTEASGIKYFVLNNMANCAIEELPASWTEQLGRELSNSAEAGIKTKVIDIIRLRSLTSLDEQLGTIAEGTDHPPLLRIEAIDALLGSDPTLSEEHFDFLLDQLQPEQEPLILQRVAAVLNRADCSEEQLLQLANNYLPQADNVMLSRLLPIYAGARDPAIGNALAGLLLKSASLDSYTEEQLQPIFAGFPSEVKPEIDQLMKKLKTVRAERLQRLNALEASIANGSIENGRKLFFGKAICWTCHTMGDAGTHFGPDLTSIQKDRSVHDILEAVVYPSASFVREYETYEVTTKTGRHIGIIREQTPEAIVLNTGPQTMIRIPQADINTMIMLDVSMMPQGLDQLLSEQEFADLMAFIMGEDLVY